MFLDKNLFSFAEVANIIGIHQRTLKNWIKKYKIELTVFGNKKYLTPEQLGFLKQLEKSKAGRPKEKIETGGPLQGVFEKLLKVVENIDERLKVIEEERKPQNSAIENTSSKLNTYTENIERRLQKIENNGDVEL